MIENELFILVFEFIDEEEKIVKGFNFLSLKFVLYIVNMVEIDLVDFESNLYF